MLFNQANTKVNLIRRDIQTTPCSIHFTKKNFFFTLNYVYAVRIFYKKKSMHKKG